MGAVSDRLRIGVAGLGAVAQAVHLPLLARRWDLFELAAVCDLSAALADDVGGQYGIPAERRYRSVDELVGSGGLDGVIMLTSGSHGVAALTALQAGVPVFCEKPLAFTVAEIDALAEAERALGRPGLLLGYMKERDPAVQALRSRLGELSGLRAVDIQVLHPSSPSQLAFANLRPPPTDVAAGPPATAMSAASLAGDELLEHALGATATERHRYLYASIVLGSIVHNTSLLRSVFGGLTTVDDVRVWPPDAEPPSVEVSGWLPGDVRARIAWHYLEDYPAYRETLTVHHASGSAQVSFGTPYVVNAGTELLLVERADDRVSGGESRSVQRWKGEAFEYELIEFHRMVTAQAPPVAGIAEGRADLLTSQRILRRLAEAEGVTLGGEAAQA